jgi:transposase
MTPRYGRALSSKRVKDYVPDTRFEKTTVISTIRLKGKAATLMFKGSLNGDTFATYVKEVLAPTLKKGDILVLDNLSSHKVPDVLDPVYERGASVMFLPPYSPDLNPVELCWSKMKETVRRLKPRSYDELVYAMKMAIDSVVTPNITNWFKHCGYIC